MAQPAYIHRDALDPFALGVATHGSVNGIMKEQLPPIWPGLCLKGRPTSLVLNDCFNIWRINGPALTNLRLQPA